MNVIKVIIALRLIFKISHAFRRTFETHTDIAPCAVNLVAPVYFHHWHLAGRIGTVPATMLLHVLLKVLVRLPHLQHVLASYPWMNSFLNNLIFTLHKLQYSILQVSH